MIDTKGLTKAEVLSFLFNNAKTQGMGVFSFTPVPLTIKDAEELLRDATYFDYLKGRVLKVSLKVDGEFDEFLYDRDNGRGAAQFAINAARKGKES